MRQFFEAHGSLNIFQISSWGVCIKFKVLIILVWLRGRAQNDDKLTNAKLYPPHVDIIKNSLKKINFMFYFFLAKHVFYYSTHQGFAVRVEHQWGVDLIAVYICRTLTSRRCRRPPPMFEKGGGFPTHPPSSFNTLAVFIMCSLPYKLTISSLVSAYHISTNMKYDFRLYLTKKKRYYRSINW